jgi:hypothetical protein
VDGLLSERDVPYLEWFSAPRFSVTELTIVSDDQRWTKKHIDQAMNDGWGRLPRATGGKPMTLNRLCPFCGAETDNVLQLHFNEKMKLPTEPEIRHCALVRQFSLRSKRRSGGL